MTLLSIVVPCYNEEETILSFYQEVMKIKEQMPPLNFEFIFVNDGSSDNTLKQLKILENKDPKQVKYLSFSRNFGKEAALYAGLKHATGDLITVMDADLQDPPSLLPKMYRLITEQNYDCIGTRRKNREGEPKIRSFFAKKFYKIINKISDVQIVDGARDFRLMTRQMVDSIVSMQEYNRYSKGLFSFVGFNTKWIEYENVERVAGETKWSFWKLFKYAIEGITAFSTVPLILSSIIGIIFCLIAAILIIVIIIKTLMFGDTTSGWPSLVCIIFFVSGVQLFSLGIIGQYLAKTYLESKQRPIYIAQETEEDLVKEDGNV